MRQGSWVPWVGGALALRPSEGSAGLAVRAGPLACSSGAWSSCSAKQGWPASHISAVWGPEGVDVWSLEEALGFNSSSTVSCLGDRGPQAQRKVP